MRWWSSGKYFNLTEEKMSRTYRFKHDDWKINSNSVLSDWDRRCDQYNPEDYDYETDN